MTIDSTEVLTHVDQLHQDPPFGHLLAGESHGPGVFGVMAKRLREQYDLSEEAVAFWSIHDVADKDHSGIGKDLLANFAKTPADGRLVIDTVNATLDRIFAFYDGMFEMMSEVH